MESRRLRFRLGSSMEPWDLATVAFRGNLLQDWALARSLEDMYRLETVFGSTEWVCPDLISIRISNRCIEPLLFHSFLRRSFRAQTPAPFDTKLPSRRCWMYSVRHAGSLVALRYITLEKAWVGYRSIELLANGVTAA
jgi:hypothetical protein